MSLTPPPYGRPHAIDMKYTSFYIKLLVQRTSGNASMISLQCFETIAYYSFVLLIYTNKKSTFYSVQNYGPKIVNFFAWEENWMTSVGYNFMSGRPHGADHPPSVGVHLSLNISSFLMDVINGWSVTYLCIYSFNGEESWQTATYHISHN